DLAVKTQMPEPREIEIRAQFAIDPRQQVEIKGGGYPGRIVVGSIEDRRGFLAVDTNQHVAATPDQPAALAQQGQRLGRQKIADGRAGEESHTFAESLLQGGRQVE